MKALLIYPAFPDTFWSFRHSLKFIRKKSAFPPLGLLTVGAMMPEEWSQRLVDLNVEKLTDEDLAWADYAFISSMIVQRKSAQQTIARCSEAGLKALTRDDLAAFHARHYVGRNAVLALIGDIKLSEAKAIAKRVLGGLPAGEAAPPLPKVADVVPRERAERMLVHPSTQTHILIGEAGMARNDPDYFALYLGNHILGGSGLVSRLSQEVREKRGLSYSVYSYFMPLREPGPFLLGLQTKNNQRAEAIAVVRRVLKEFVEKGPTAEELVAAKKNVTGGFPLRIDSNRKIAEYLTVIGFYNLPLSYIDDFIPRIEAVTAEQIRDAFRRRVHPERMLTVVVGGGGQ